MFLRLSFVFFILVSFQATAEIEVPDAVRDQIVSEVMSETGYFDAAEIEARILLWIVEQPQPNASGEMLSSGDCSNSCTQNGGDGSLPKPRNVKFVSKKTNGKLSKHLVIKWKRPSALPNNSELELKRYKINLSKDGQTFKKYKVEAKFKNNDKPKTHQKLKLRNLEDGEYTVQVRAIYKSKVDTASLKTNSTTNSSTNNLSTNSEWTIESSANVQKDASIVGSIPPQSLELYSCLIENGYDDDTPIVDVTSLVCVNKQFTDADVSPLNGFTGLTLLNLQDNPAITDISFLSSENLSQLAWLSLKKNPLIDLSQNNSLNNTLKLLPSLETVYLNKMDLTEIPELPDSISFVNVSQNKISNHYGNFPEDNVIDTLIINNNKIDGVLSLNDAFFFSLGDDNKFVKTLQAKNNNLTNISNLENIGHLLNLTLVSNSLDADQDFSLFSGFCSLNIKSNSVERLFPARPVKLLYLENNDLLKQLDLLTGSLTSTGGSNTKSSIAGISSVPNPNPYSPVQLNLTGSEGLSCSNYYEVVDFNAPEFTNPGPNQIPLFYLPNGDPAYSPSCPETPIASLKQMPSQCKPNEVVSFDVYEDQLTSTRFLTWEKNPDHDFVTWEVIGYEILMYDAGNNVVDSRIVDLNSPQALTLFSTEPVKYSISVCTATQCGDQLNASSNQFQTGISKVIDVEVNWSQLDKDDPNFQFKFSYPEELLALNSAESGKPDYFLIETEFPQVSGETLIQT